MPPKFNSLQPGPAKVLKVLEAHHPGGLTSRQIRDVILVDNPEASCQTIASWTRIALASNQCHCQYKGAKGGCRYFFGPGFIQGLTIVRGPIDA
jgi:hypothetical protein